MQAVRSGSAAASFAPILHFSIHTTSAAPPPLRPPSRYPATSIFCQLSNFQSPVSGCVLPEMSRETRAEVQDRGKILVLECTLTSENFPAGYNGVGGACDAERDGVRPSVLPFTVNSSFVGRSLHLCRKQLENRRIPGLVTIVIVSAKVSLRSNNPVQQTGSWTCTALFDPF